MKMNIKASVKKLSKKTLFLVFGVEGIIFTALRFYQMNSLTDPETGFFTDRGNFTVPLFYALWFVTVLGSLLLFYISADSNTEAYGVRKDFALGIGSLIMAAGAVYDAYSRFAAMKGQLAGLSLFTYIRAEKAYLAFGCIIFAVLSVLVFLADAAAFFTGSAFNKSLKVCHLFPVLWMFCLTTCYFSITVSYLNVSQLMLMIFADAFFMVFLFEFARFITGVGIAEAPWLLFATGVTAEILLIASVLPTLVFTVSGQTEKIVANCPLNVYDIAAAVFTVFALISAAVNKNYTVIHLEPAGAAETDSVSAQEENKE